ncbi:MAG TPA: endonuclease V [Candidatus Binatia bacterium]|nr:endonuclease V [Candidatus Binatia bacterium]
MIACLDVDYRDTTAYAAAITFREWLDATPAEEGVVAVSDVQPYEPGQFFRRELPCLLAVLRMLYGVAVVIVDGYVWLDDMRKPGLGAHLYRALNGQVAVIGVAKSKFREAHGACEVTRGASIRPLYITAAGMDSEAAAQHIRSMHGCYRIPTLLKRVDCLCRSDRVAPNTTR